jgi:hypothetical protein
MVSVIIPAYKATKYIDECINSIKSDIEYDSNNIKGGFIVILRDGSRDYIGNTSGLEPSIEELNYYGTTHYRNIKLKNPKWKYGFYAGQDSFHNVIINNENENLYLDEKLYEFRTTELDPIDLLKKINCFRAICPNQGNNGTECGVFTVKYFEKMVELFPATKLSSQEAKLKDIFHDFNFSLSDSKEYRLQFRQQIEELRNEYLESQESNINNNNN